MFINLISNWMPKKQEEMTYFISIFVFVRILTWMLAFSYHCRYHCHCLDRLPVRCHYQHWWPQHCIFQSIYMVMVVVSPTQNVRQHPESIHCRQSETVNWLRKKIEYLFLFNLFLWLCLSWLVFIYIVRWWLYHNFWLPK